MESTVGLNDTDVMTALAAVLLSFMLLEKYIDDSVNFRRSDVLPVASAD